MMTTTYMIELEAETWVFFCNTGENEWKNDVKALRKKYPKRNFRVVKMQIITETLTETLG
jgi:hypothetical protein